MEKNFTVRLIPNSWAKPWILYRHYARRMCSISLAYGLLDESNTLKGICTFGHPPTSQLKSKYVFEDFDVEVLELNRLAIEEGMDKNTLSYFVSSILRIMESPKCLISYADGNQGHVGYIYQATNWIYTGISSGQDFYEDSRNGTIYHPKTIVDKFGTRCLDKIPEYFIKHKEVSGKHRYFYFVGSKKQTKEMRKQFKYQIFPYPKGESRRYDFGKERKGKGFLYKV